MSFSTEFVALLVSLFVITDPLGNVGIFLSITEGDDLAFRRRQAFKGNLYGAILLLVFLFGGPYILDFFGISLHAVDLGGGLIVGAVGWSLIRAKEDRKHCGTKGHPEASEMTDISFCPLALPLIAGPGAIAVVIDAGRHAMERGGMVWIADGLAVITAMLISWICLRESQFVLRVLGENGMKALTKIMGFLLVCIAAQMMITGARGAFGLDSSTAAHTSVKVPAATPASATHGQ